MTLEINEWLAEKKHAKIETSLHSDHEVNDCLGVFFCEKKTFQKLCYKSYFQKYWVAWPQPMRLGRSFSSLFSLLLFFACVDCRCFLTYARTLWANWTKVYKWKNGHKTHMKTFFMTIYEEKKTTQPTIKWRGMRPNIHIICGQKRWNQWNNLYTLRFSWFACIFAHEWKNDRTWYGSFGMLVLL